MKKDFHLYLITIMGDQDGGIRKVFDIVLVNKGMKRLDCSSSLITQEKSLDITFTFSRDIF